MRLINKDITEETSGWIIQGVNCQRVMGSGCALAIKTKWPVVYDQYMASGKGKHMLGRIHIVDITPKLSIVNCYTQEFYGRDGARYASVEAIDKILHKVFMQCYLHKIQLKSPKIGCNLGGLDWELDVKPLFETYEEHFDIETEIYYI